MNWYRMFKHDKIRSVWRPHESEAVMMMIYSVRVEQGLQPRPMTYFFLCPATFPRLGSPMRPVER